MVDITSKQNTLRIAIASAIVRVSSRETIQRVINKTVPKGDIFEFARAAGLLGIKRTSDVIPDCHPLPVEYAHISYDVQDLDIRISVEVHTIYKTGVEVEAMHGASVVALVIYDMLKPIDPAVEIGSIRLERKTGGKSDRKTTKTLPPGSALSCAVIVCSDSVSKGESDDRSGSVVTERLQHLGIELRDTRVAPDDVDAIRALVQQYIDKGIDLVILTGGTGLSQRDVTPEAVTPLIDRPIPGIMEVARQYGQQRMPYAMLSRGIAGFAGRTLVLTLPGSVKGVEETMDAIFPHVLHVFSIRDGAKH
jgi:cyclic pyranopterin monophosphate synthase